MTENSRSEILRRVAVPLLFAALVVPAGHAVAGSPWDEARVEHAGTTEITVYRSPTCGCCSGWIEHLERHGFTVRDIKRDDVGPVKSQLGVSGELASCHTAVIDGYVIEGHVPADDIKRLVTEKPAVAGLSVPGMPTGGPGMEMGERKDPFAVLSFDRDGNVEPYSQYWSY